MARSKGSRGSEIVTFSAAGTSILVVDVTFVACGFLCRLGLRQGDAAFLAS